MKLMKWDSKYVWKSYKENEGFMNKIRVESVLMKILNCLRKLMQRNRELGALPSSLLQTNWDMRLRANRRRLFGNSD
jgi:hypothetical protein